MPALRSWHLSEGRWQVDLQPLVSLAAEAVQQRQAAATRPAGADVCCQWLLPPTASLSPQPCASHCRSPYRSYARRPGATQCVRCVGGVAKCVVGADAGCTPDLADAPSEGYHVLSLTTPATLPSAACALPSPLSFGTPPLFGTCTLAAGTPTKLSLYVDQWCGVEIYPMADAACAEPAAAYWSSMRVKAHYVAPGLIAGTVGAASRCPGGGGGPVPACAARAASLRLLLPTHASSALAYQST